MQLAGVEKATIEVEGSIPEAAARRLLGDLPPEPAESGRARVGLLVFRMRSLKPRGLPAPGSGDQEALFRVGALLDGEAAWLCPACDNDRAHVRILGAWLVRYPVTAARIALDAGDDTFRLDMHAAGAPRAHGHLSRRRLAPAAAAAPGAGPLGGAACTRSPGASTPTPSAAPPRSPSPRTRAPAQRSSSAPARTSCGIPRVSSSAVAPMAAAWRGGGNHPEHHPGPEVAPFTHHASRNSWIDPNE